MPRLLILDGTPVTGYFLATRVIFRYCSLDDRRTFTKGSRTSKRFQSCDRDTKHHEPPQAGESKSHSTEHPEIKSAQISGKDDYPVVGWLEG
jgi:hypothetical protein